MDKGRNIMTDEEEVDLEEWEEDAEWEEAVAASTIAERENSTANQDQTKCNYSLIFILRFLN